MDSKRNISFFNTERAVASPRVKVILNNPADSEKLAEAIRNARRSGLDTQFTISESTRSAISK